MNPPELNHTITVDYLEQQRKLHKNPNYGVASLNFAPIVADVMRQTGCKLVRTMGQCPKAAEMVTHTIPISGLTRSHRIPPTALQNGYDIAQFFYNDRDLNDTVLEYHIACNMIYYK